MLRRSTTTGRPSLLQAVEIERAELVPFGDDDERVGALGAAIGVVAVVDVGQHLPRLLHADRIEGPNLGADVQQRRTSGIEGASRMSSVFGLKVRPSTAMVLPRMSAQRAMTLRAMARLRFSLTATTVSTMRIGMS